VKKKKGGSTGDVLLEGEKLVRPSQGDSHNNWNRRAARHGVIGKRVIYVGGRKSRKEDRHWNSKGELIPVIRKDTISLQRVYGWILRER